MSATVNYEKYQLNAEAFTLTDSVKVECKTQLAEGDKILLVTPFITSCGNEILPSTLKYTGKAVFTVCTQNSSGLGKQECATEFLGTLKNEKILPEFSAETSFEIIKTERNELNGFLIITATVAVKTKFYQPLLQEYAVGGENLIVKTDNACIAKSLGKRTSDTTISEEFELPQSVGEVIFHKEDFLITSVQCGIGCLIIDGELTISLFILQKNQNGDIVKENKILPVRIEVDEPNAMPTMRVKATAKVKNAKLAVTSFEETSSSTVQASVTLSVASEIFTCEEIPVMTDCFSKAEELELEKTELISCEPSALLNFSQNFNGKIINEGFTGSEKLLTVMAEYVKPISCEKSGNSVCVDAVINCVIFYKTEDGTVICRKDDLPITLCEQLPVALANCSAEVISSCVSEILVKPVSGSEIEVYGTAKFALSLDCECKIPAVKRVNLKGEKKPNTVAFSVYIALENEDLWSLAKRLGVSPDELCASNPELEFPLVGNERIVIYRRKNKEYS